MSEDSSGAEAALVAARRAKAARLLARGSNPFANDVDAGSRVRVAELRARAEGALLDAAERRYDAAKLGELDLGQQLVLGRIVARRDFGKACFLRLRDASGELQLFAKKDALGGDFELLEQLDIADHVQARGRPMVTRTGELTLELTSLRIIAKALRPLPDKWHGLSDVDLRYRQRYVDFVANAEAAAVLRARSAIVRALREFLDQRGFLEVESPTLHQLVGGAAARPFTTHHNVLDLDLFLRIAPELYLKRLLVAGFERVYEIGRCYRNEGISTRHNPEFTMLEYYQAYATYETLMDSTELMFRHVDARLGQELAAQGLAEQYAEWVSRRGFTLAEPFARVPIRRAALASLERAGLGAEVLERLKDVAVSEGRPRDPASDELVKGWATRSERAKRVDWGNLRRALWACDSDGERLFVAYEYLAEPFLAEDYRSRDGRHSVPVFIVDYPAETSPLARKKDADPSLVDRFELFVEGRELCNAFSELNDPDDQAERFRTQVEKKSRGALETMDYDADYVRALEHGMPPAAGFGLGIDRLVMTLTSQPSIRDVIAFPLMRPEEGA